MAREAVVKNNVATIRDVENELAEGAGTRVVGILNKELVEEDFKGSDIDSLSLESGGIASVNGEGFGCVCVVVEV